MIRPCQAFLSLTGKSGHLISCFVLRHDVEGMATAQQPIVTRKRANACVVPPNPRRVRQESANTTTETIRAGNYAKITVRGRGQHQRFVSAYLRCTPQV
jgi:hypothetical protein